MSRNHASAGAVLIFVLALGACRRSSGARAPEPSVDPVPVATTGAQTRTSTGPVQIEMRRVHLRLTDSIALEVEHLRGEMESSGDRFPVFDDQASFTLRVASAEIAMTTDSLTALMNERVFRDGEASLEDLSVETEGHQLKVKGDLKKGITLPFTMKADVAPAGGTRIRLRPTSMKAIGIQAFKIMKLFDIDLDEMVDDERATGLQVGEKEMVLDVARALPPPRIRGSLTRIRVENGRVLQSFRSADGEGARRLAPPLPQANYVFFRGHTIRFGKLTMHDADLQLVDADGSDPFDFYPNKYLGQLVAGYSKNQPDGGLVTYMPDYSDMVRSARRSPPAPGASGSRSRD